MSILTGEIETDITKISKEAKTKLNFIQKLIIEEFKQQNNKSGWVDKYFAGNFKELAQQILKQPINDLKQMCQSVATATTGVDQIKLDAEAAAEALKTKGAETNPKLGEYSKSLEPHAQKLGIKNVNSLLKALDKLGMLK